TYPDPIPWPGDTRRRRGPTQHRWASLYAAPSCGRVRLVFGAWTPSSRLPAQATPMAVVGQLPQVRPASLTQAVIPSGLQGFLLCGVLANDRTIHHRQKGSASQWSGGAKDQIVRRRFFKQGHVIVFPAAYVAHRS